MTLEQANDLNLWWEQQSFSGKELFKLEESGDLVLCAKPNITERTIATITAENGDATLKNLVEKFDTVLSRMREAEVEWQATDDKLKLADKVEGLKDYLQHVAAIGDFEKPMGIVADWDKGIKALIEVNVQAKTQLAEQAEALAESTDWKETNQAFKEILDRWKQTGYIDRGRNDKLYNRIEAARKAFADRKRLHQEDEEKDLFLTLDLKIELAEKAEALANSSEWKAATEAFVQIIEKWKTIGRTLPKKNEELWQRIMTARSTFFDRKKEHYNMVQGEQEANYVLKLAIVERAEALRESTEWNNTALAFAGLMEEWKKTGRIAADKGEELWKRYNEAQEQFFEARKKHTESTRMAMENNFNLKSALLKKAEEIKNSNRWGETTIEMNRIFDEWKKIGPVPREHNNTMWDAFLGARKHFFNRKDANRDQRKMFAEAQKSARMEQAYTIVHKMREEIAVEEEKLADFKNALDNVTPGKKADELRTHLEVLISDSNARMKRLKEKLAAGEDELQHIQEEERAKKQKDEAAAAKEKEGSTATAEPKEEVAVHAEVAEPVAETREPEVVAEANAEDAPQN